MDWRKPDIPAKFQTLYEKGRAGSPKAAIRAMCAMCCGFDAKEVEQCTATGCPLYTLRNLIAQSQTESANRAKRRQRALASGQRPRKLAVVDRHGAHVQASISNAADPPATPTPPDSSLGPKRAFTTGTSHA